MRSKRGPNEAADLATVEAIVRSYGLIPERFGKAEVRRGKTPDFRLFRSNKLVAYCEVKSPRDDWLNTKLDEAAPGQVVGGLRSDPIFNKLSEMVEKAASQFDAVNLNREYPNILLFLNHDRMSDYGDLTETLTGMFHSADGSWHPTMTHVSEGKIRELKHRIDAYGWIDRRTNRIQGWFVTESILEHYKAVCSMFSIDNGRIVRPG